MGCGTTRVVDDASDEKLTLSSNEENQERSNSQWIYDFRNHDAPRIKNRVDAVDIYESDTEENRKVLAENETKPKELGIVHVMLTQRTPNHLPLPRDEEEYRERFLYVERYDNDRKSTFLRRTLEDYCRAREMYHTALTQIIFSVDSSFESIRNIYPLYSPRVHLENLKKVILLILKIGQCDYFLGLYEEAMNILKFNLFIGDLAMEYGMNSKGMKLTYATMGKIMIVQGKLARAKEYIEMGLALDPGSGILRKCKEEVIGLLRRDDSKNDRFYVMANSEQFDFETYRIRFISGKVSTSVMIGVDERERIRYVLDRSVLRRQNLDHVAVAFSQGRNTILLWKSFFC